MPRALNEFEKRDRILAKQAERNAPAEQAARPAVDGATRKRRNTFNGTEAKLSVRQQIEGYHLHVLTDAGSRIQEAMDSGYEFDAQRWFKLRHHLQKLIQHFVVDAQNIHVSEERQDVFVHP